MLITEALLWEIKPCPDRTIWNFLLAAYYFILNHFPFENLLSLLFLETGRLWRKGVSAGLVVLDFLRKEHYGAGTEVMLFVGRADLIEFEDL